MGVSMFDVANNRWSQFPDFGFVTGVGDPAMCEVGGQLFVIDETNLNNVYFIDVSAALSTVGYRWSVPTIIDAPTGRFGMRFFSWGPLVYAFGGVDFAGATAGTFHNDIWALSAGSLIAGTFPVSTWSLVAPDGVVNFPPARVGYTVVAFGSVVIMYGGVSLDAGAPPGTLPDVCFTPGTAFCHFHHNVCVPAPRSPPAASRTRAAHLSHTHLPPPAHPPGGPFPLETPARPAR